MKAEKTNEKGKQGRYVDLLGDAGFKAVYADRNNKPLLIALLNMVLPENVRVSDIVEYLDREQTPQTVYGKKTILDLSCRDDKGNIFSIEVQKVTDWNFFKRCIFYAAGQYHGQLLEGGDYDSLHPVFEIAFLKDKMEHDDESLWDTDELIARYTVSEMRTTEHRGQTIFAIFAELGRFTKTAAECRSERDRVFYWFKHGWMSEDAPRFEGQDEGYDALVRASEIAAFSPEKKAIYEADKMTERDIIYNERKQFDIGKAEGLQEGRDEGLKEGLERGHTEGRREGIQEGRLEVAKNLLALNMPLEQIVFVSGLTEDQVRELMQ